MTILSPKKVTIIVKGISRFSAITRNITCSFTNIVTIFGDSPGKSPFLVKKLSLFLSKKNLGSYLLWVPKVVFYNTKERLESMVDGKTSMEVERMGNFTVAKNKLVFEGSENPLSVSRFYKTSFICDFDMAWYPFDTFKNAQ